MNAVLSSYLPIVIFIGVALVVGLALIAAPFLVAYRNPDPEKLSAYECGFNSFDDARMKFDVRFYLVSILFIIFDLEVAFLFPWAITLREIEGLSYEEIAQVMNCPIGTVRSRIFRAREAIASDETSLLRDLVDSYRYGHLLREGVLTCSPTATAAPPVNAVWPSMMMRTIKLPGTTLTAFGFTRVEMV